MAKKSSVGNAQIQADLRAGQALCDPSGRGRHVIKGKTVFQQGPGNNQNPPWSAFPFAGSTVTNRGDILCVLASIIDMIGTSTTNPGLLATNYTALTGTPPKFNYPTNALLKTILNDFGCAILPIYTSPRIFQYMLAYNGYIILYGSGGAITSPPFLIAPPGGHFVYIHTYDPVTDLYFIGQSFGNQGALLDHVRGYRFTDLVKQTDAEGGVITAFGVIANRFRRIAASTSSRSVAVGRTGVTGATYGTDGFTVYAKIPTPPIDPNGFTWFGLGTTVLAREARELKITALTAYGGERYTFFDKAKAKLVDETWGDGGTGLNDGNTQYLGYQHTTSLVGTTREGYGIYRDNNMDNENNIALRNGRPRPHANVLFISLIATPFGDEGDDDPVSLAASRIPYTTNPDGSTVVPVVADRWVVDGTSPDGYALYINLTQAQLANNVTAGTPRFIRLDGNYVPYIPIPNPANTGPGSLVPSLMTQIAPGNHTIFKYNKNNPTIANISIPGAVAGVGQ